MFSSFDIFLNACLELVQRYVLVSGCGKYVRDMVLVSGITNSSANLDQRGGDVYLGRVSKAITDNVGTTVVVIDVLTFKTGTQTDKHSRKCGCFSYLLG